jgi:hypothetical protein
MAAESPAPRCRIFISYRREDTAYPAGWLSDRLTEHYGKEQVFKDVDSIELGDDFVEAINDAVGSCDVLLALIGSRWPSITDKDGHRRLDSPNDYVRLEIEAALERSSVVVIPILVEGAQMPPADELPESLAGLVRKNALELSPARFDFDTGRLLKVLERVSKPTAGPDEVDGQQTPREDERAPVGGSGRVPPVAGGVPPGRDEGSSGQQKRPFKRAAIIAGAAVGAGLAVVLAVILLTRSNPAASPSGPSAPSGASSAAVIFRDDFSGTANGWRVVAGGSGGYSNGTYHISTPPLRDMALALPENATRLMQSAPQNLSAEVTARTLKDPGHTDHYGIACRQGPWGAYVFLMTDQGVYLEKWLGGSTTEHDSIIVYLSLRSNATNKLRAVCTSAGRGAVHLAFWVNGLKLADWTDTQNPFTHGTVGLIDWSLSTTKTTEAEFDNFAVSTVAAGH